MSERQMSERQLLLSSKTPIQGVKRRGYQHQFFMFLNWPFFCYFQTSPVPCSIKFYEVWEQFYLAQTWQLFLVFVATQACFFLFFLLFKVVLFFSVVCKPGFFTCGGSMVFLETVPLNVTKVLKPVAIQWAFEDPDPVSHLKPGSIPWPQIPK